MRISDRRLDNLEKKFKPDKQCVTIFQDILECEAGLKKYYYMDEKKGKTQITLEEAKLRFNEERYNLIILSFVNEPLPEKDNDYV